MASDLSLRSPSSMTLPVFVGPTFRELRRVCRQKEATPIAFTPNQQAFFRDLFALLAETVRYGEIQTASHIQGRSSYSTVMVSTLVAAQDEAEHKRDREWESLLRRVQTEFIERHRIEDNLPERAAVHLLREAKLLADQVAGFKTEVALLEPKNLLPQVDGKFLQFIPRWWLRHLPNSDAEKQEEQLRATSEQLRDIYLLLMMKSPTIPASTDERQQLAYRRSQDAAWDSFTMLAFETLEKRVTALARVSEGSEWVDLKICYYLTHMLVLIHSLQLRFCPELVIQKREAREEMTSESLFAEFDRLQAILFPSAVGEASAPAAAAAAPPADASPKPAKKRGFFSGFTLPRMPLRLDRVTTPNSPRQEPPISSGKESPLSPGKESSSQGSPRRVLVSQLMLSRADTLAEREFVTGFAQLSDSLNALFELLSVKAKRPTLSSTQTVERVSHARTLLRQDSSSSISDDPSASPLSPRIAHTGNLAALLGKAHTLCRKVYTEMRPDNTTPRQEPDSRVQHQSELFDVGNPVVRKLFPDLQYLIGSLGQIFDRIIALQNGSRPTTLYLSSMESREQRENEELVLPILRNFEAEHPLPTDASEEELSQRAYLRWQMERELSKRVFPTFTGMQDLSVFKDDLCTPISNRHLKVLAEAVYSATPLNTSQKAAEAAMTAHSPVESPVNHFENWAQGLKLKEALEINLGHGKILSLAASPKANFIEKMMRYLGETRAAILKEAQLLPADLANSASPKWSEVKEEQLELLLLDHLIGAYMWLQNAIKKMDGAGRTPIVEPLETLSDRLKQTENTLREIRPDLSQTPSMPPPESDQQLQQISARDQLQQALMILGDMSNELCTLLNIKDQRLRILEESTRLAKQSMVAAAKGTGDQVSMSSEAFQEWQRLEEKRENDLRRGREEQQLRLHLEKVIRLATDVSTPIFAAPPPSIELPFKKGHLGLLGRSSMY